MLLRQLYFSKRQAAASRKAELMAQLQQEGVNPLEGAMRTAELGAELQRNATEEHQMLNSIAASLYCGVI